MDEGAWTGGEAGLSRRKTDRRPRGRIARGRLVFRGALKNASNRFNGDWFALMSSWWWGLWVSLFFRAVSAASRWASCLNGLCGRCRCDSCGFGLIHHSKGLNGLCGRCRCDCSASAAPHQEGCPNGLCGRCRCDPTSNESGTPKIRKAPSSGRPSDLWVSPFVPWSFEERIEQVQRGLVRAGV
jgi:hypothetical protein